MLFSIFINACINKYALSHMHKYAFQFSTEHSETPAETLREVVTPRQLWPSPLQSRHTLGRELSIRMVQRMKAEHLIAPSSLTSLSGNAQTLHTVTAMQKGLDSSIASLKQHWRESAVSLLHGSFIFAHLHDSTLTQDLVVVYFS